MTSKGRFGALSVLHRGDLAPRLCRTTTPKSANLQLRRLVEEYRGKSNLTEVYGMKTSVVSMTLAMIALLSVPGCASTPSASSSQSKALQIARAAGYKQIRDVRNEDFESAIRERPDVTTSNVLTTVGVGTQFFSQQTGWSLGAETGALSVLTILSALPVHVPERETRIIAWMPASAASSGDEASELFEKAVVNAFASTLPGYDVTVDQRFFTGSGSGTKRYLKIVGPNCAPCETYSGFLATPGTPKVKKAPAQFGGGEAYVWGASTRASGQFEGFPMTAAHLNVEERMDVLTKVSAALPRWAYLYVAPDERLTGFPLILHQGRPMFFTEPGA